MYDFHVNRIPKFAPLEAAYNFPKAKHVHHRRVKNSHRGISKLRHLQSLSAVSVNQEYLDEICKLENLSLLILDMVSAEDLSGLANLKNIKLLKISFAHRTSDFSFIRELPKLEGLYFRHLKQLTNYGFLSGLNNIKRLEIGGATNGTKQKIDSLKPLGTMKSLEEIYMAIVTLKDKELTYLANCPKLNLFDCSRMAPKKSFEALREAMPNLKCEYCDDYRHPWQR